MTTMDFSGVSCDALRVPNFESQQEKGEYMEAMYNGEVPVPLLFKAMGVDFTDEEYVSEAIRLRCIGALSAAAPGYAVTREDMTHCTAAQRRERFLDANDRRAREQVDAVREQHPLGMLAGNVMKKLTGYTRSVDVYGKSQGVDMLCAGAGILEEDDLRQAGEYPSMEIVPIVSSSTAARWIVRVAKRLRQRIRMLCVELPQFAGGHLGASSAQEADTAEKFDPVAIREGIRKHAPQTPVILAGAIAYRDQIKEALCMGYQGVGIGTRGLLTRESKLDDRLITEYYLNPAIKVVTNDSSPTGYPGRYLDIPRARQSPEEWAAYVRYAVRNCISCIEPGSCLFLRDAAHPEQVQHFCIGQDLPRTRFGEEGGVCFTGTERDRIMQDALYHDGNGQLRVPSMEEALEFMLTHDAPPHHA